MKKSDKEIKDKISKAVDNIPGLIVEHAKFKQVKAKKSETKKQKPPVIKHNNNYSDQKKRKAMLWFGVIFIVVIIIIMWTLNIKTMIYDIDFKDDPNEKNIFEKAQESYYETKEEYTIKKDTLSPIIEQTDQTEIDTEKNIAKKDEEELKTSPFAKATEDKQENEELKTQIVNLLSNILSTTTTTSTAN